MCSVLTSIRLPTALLNELKTLAQEETERTGERVTFARLLRDGARHLVQEAKRRKPKPGT
jgi:hypothetical protein